MKNREIARVLRLLALYLRMDGVSFKPQALERAADGIEAFSGDIGVLYGKEGIKGLEAIPGVGRGIAQKAEEYLAAGRVKDLEDYKQKIGMDVEEITRVEGIGPKMAKELWVKLKIKNLKELEAAARAGKVRALPGFGEKKESNILDGIAFLNRSRGRLSLGVAYPFAKECERIFKESGLVDNVVAAGSVRRMKETIGDVDLLVSSNNPKAVMEFALQSIPHEKVWGAGETKTSMRSAWGFDIDIRVVKKDAFGAALQYFTGSKEHNVKLRARAMQLGYKLSEYGLFRGEKLIASRTEEDIYRALGLRYIEPEMREDAGEIEAAAQGVLPAPIGYGDLRGDLQTQTDWTDGEDSIETMALEAKKAGLEYIAITDHTQDLAMTRGSDEKRLLRQMAEIDTLNKKISGFRVLKGAEVNIRKDGSLDIQDEVLAQLDVVGVSVHSLFRMTSKDMTERISRAMRNPFVDILFHPTGRLVLKRDAYQVDMAEIIRVAKETGTILEINAFPERLDLKDTHIRQAVDAGVKMAIDSDAHQKGHFEVLRYGIGQAKRGWARKQDIINTKDVAECLASLKKSPE
ncbi:MAG: DNA polymerase/3'-5' exonuclease PolX [Candidatus Wildermuthbacteria bacterium]|nr:DNA polymerase/3'-5' exonuclease PolX [Candidatus Wildermuthbacteria bacterium]